MDLLRKKLDPAFLKGLSVVWLLALLVWQWQGRRPKPPELSVTLDVPAATRLEKDAKPESLRLRFSGSAAPLERVGKALSSGVTLSPGLRGQWRWAGDRELVFTPGEDWPVGQAYVVRLAPSLLAAHVRLESMEKRFSSAGFSAAFVSSAFDVDLMDPTVKRAVATLRFSHAVDGTDLEKRLLLREEGKIKRLWGAKPMPFTVTYDAFRGEAYVKSSALEVPPEDLFLSLKLSGARSARGGPPFETGLEARIRVPGLENYFRVQDAQVTIARDERSEPQQVLVVETTAGCRDWDLLKALSLGDPGDPLALQALPADRDWPTTHSFRFHAPPGRRLRLRIAKGLPALGGYSLARDYMSVLTAPDFPKELHVLHDGALLQLSGDKKLSLVSRGLTGLHFELGRVLPDRLNHLITQTSGDFKNPSFDGYRFGPDDITERFTETRLLKTDSPEKTQYTAFDFSPYLARGVFLFKARSWDPLKKQFEQDGLEDNRLILITDLGLLVKEEAGGGRQVFVQSLADGRPASGVTVSVLGRNGLAVATAVTEGDGRAVFPRLSDFEREKAPVAFLARRGSDLSFLPYDRADRRLDLSRFDTGGLTGDGTGERLDAYLFSDRGLYRPGDAFHLGLIVRSQKTWSQGLTGLPLELVITDPRGLEVVRQRLSLPAGGFDEFSHRTEEHAPTGTYQAGLYVVRDGKRGALLGSTSVRVEEFLPDRLKIAARLSAEPMAEGWTDPQALRGLVSLRNLFGTPAEGRRITGSLTLSPASPSFSAYPGFTFLDPLQARKSFTDRLPEGRTDAKGEAELPLDLERFDRATYRLNFLAEGFEAESGRGVAAQAGSLVSPLKALVGWKQDGELTYLHRASSHSVRLLAIGPDLKPLALSGLKTRLTELRFVSALLKQKDGVYRYQSVERELTKWERPMELSEDGARLALDTGAPGDFRLLVVDANGLALAKVAYTVVGEANLTRSLEKNAELQVRLSKSDYAPGEQIELELRAPYVGAGLITIERDRVYAHHWFKTSTTHSTQRITVPEDLEGNAYVMVTFLRDPSSKEIFMSPLSSGVAPFTISRARRILPIELAVPETVRPGQRLRLRARTSSPSRLVLFAIDEGILQVARYQAPDPLSHFLRKRALETRTSQILDLLLPEFRLIQALSAPGGDADGFDAVGKNLNPFKRRRDKPAVFWSGVMVSSGAWRETSFEVPDTFNGNLKVFAVAVGDSAIGTVQAQTLVRGDFVLSPNVPAFAAPGDEFDVSVGVANLAKGSGPEAKVDVALSVSPQLQLLGDKSRRLEIGEGREGSTSFRVRVSTHLGAARLSFTAASKTLRQAQAVELSVRPAMPYAVTSTGGATGRGRAQAQVGRRLLPEYRKLTAAASPLPLALAHGLMTYLEAYPYGCTEQLVSKTLPAIVLRGRPEFALGPKDVEERVGRVFGMLRARQAPDGAFGYWDANSMVSDMQSAYAVHFLLEARDRGYAVPVDLLEKGLSYLRALPDGGGADLSQARLRAYGLYLLTRSGERTTSALASLRERLEDAKSVWKPDLAGVYLAASYKLLRLDAEADKLIAAARFGQTGSDDPVRFHDGLMRDSQLLYLLSRHFPNRLDAVGPKALRSVVDPILAQRYSTISSAFAILALDAYAEARPVLPGQDVVLSEVFEDGRMKPLSPSKGLFAEAAVSGAAQALQVVNHTDMTVFYQLTAAGFDEGLPQKAVVQGLEVQREYRDASGKAVSQAPLGGELEVHLKIRAVGASRPHIAVVDLLPGGFEVVEGSLRRPGESSGSFPEAVDAREDRVLVFGQVSTAIQDFVYKIKAVNQGSYTVPPAFGESMYDRSVIARGLAGRMDVEAP